MRLSAGTAARRLGTRCPDGLPHIEHDGTAVERALRAVLEPAEGVAEKTGAGEAGCRTMFCILLNK